MPTNDHPPAAYERFVKRYPTLEDAWNLIHCAGDEGPLDAKTLRLIKLGMAMGAMREGQVHAGVRKALKIGITKEEIEQVVALLPATLGMPSTVASFCWVNDILDVTEE
ncbi:MAG: 4-carboxymuconolactone decarboxylase [Planctomycetota bacterium]|jgi:4-carboxymuconolactone decarboxylase